MSLLTIGDQFPAYRLTALVGGDLSKVNAEQPEDYFTTISSDDYPGKWRVVFFWPKDFTFVCPTEIACGTAEVMLFGNRHERPQACDRRLIILIGHAYQYSVRYHVYFTVI